MRGPWGHTRQFTELADQADEARRVRSLEVAVAENRRLDGLLETRVEELERAVVEVFRRDEKAEELSQEG